MRRTVRDYLSGVWRYTLMVEDLFLSRRDNNQVNL